MPFVQFDSNPLDLRSPKVESVSTLFDLMKNPQTSPNTIDVPALSLADADSVAAPHLPQEPLVAQALTLSSFVPDQQKEKLALIADAANLLDSTLNPLDVLPPPSDADDCRGLQEHRRKAARRRRHGARQAGPRCPPPGRCAGRHGQAGAPAIAPGRAKRSCQV